MNDLFVRLRAPVRRGRDQEATDAELLSAFVDRRDEWAFEGLLRRHGPTVLRVCRRILGASPDAEDAFQATFLVLVRKAGAVRPRSALAGWLYGVAVRASHQVRTAQARRRMKEKEAATMPRPAELEASSAETVSALHRELGRLPLELRAAVVLCDLEGKPRSVAARQLGWPEGTVASRLARARRRLARRLGGSLAVLAAPAVPMAIPSRLMARTLSAATQFAAGTRAAESASAVAAAEEVITEMLVTKLTKLAAGLVAIVATAALVLGVASAPTSAAPAIKSKPPRDDLADALKTARPINVPLLGHDEVQSELKCTPEQRQAITDLIKTGNEEYLAATQRAVRQLVAARGGAAGGAMKAAGPTAVKYDIDKLASILKPEQLIRFRQCELHLKGPHAFADRRVVRALGMTAEQELKVEEIIVRYEPEYSSQLVGAFTGGKDGEKALDDLGTKFTDECVKLLTKEQKATWDWLVGKRPEGGSWVRAMTPVFGAAAEKLLNLQGGVIGVGMPGKPGVVLPPAAVGGAGVAVAPPPPPVEPPKKVVAEKK